MSGTTTKLYCSWYCPFAQRAWIALLAKGVDFEYIEQDPYDKTAEWLAINPRGLIPVIVHDNKSIYESSVCIEYVDEMWPGERESNLLPSDPYGRAYARIWGDYVNKKIVSLFYALLIKQSEDEWEEIKEQLSCNLLELVKAMDPAGPFFQGNRLGYVDIMLAPHAARFFVLKHFRGFECPQIEDFGRFFKWWDAVKSAPCVKATLQDEPKLLHQYKGYADATYKSEVANAIKKGTLMP